MTWNGVSASVMSEPQLKMPASTRRASFGAIGRMPNSSPAPMIASQRSPPLELSSRFTSNPGTADHPVRVMTTGMPSISKWSHQ